MTFGFRPPSAHGSLTRFPSSFDSRTFYFRASSRCQSRKARRVRRPNENRLGVQRTTLNGPRTFSRLSENVINIYTRVYVYRRETNFAGTREIRPRSTKYGPRREQRRKKSSSFERKRRQSSRPLRTECSATLRKLFFNNGHKLNIITYNCTNQLFVVECGTRHSGRQSCVSFRGGHCLENNTTARIPIINIIKISRKRRAVKAISDRARRNCVAHVFWTLKRFGMNWICMYARVRRSSKQSWRFKRGRTNEKKPFLYLRPSTRRSSRSIDIPKPGPVQRTR